ncbi:MAG: hypothetical protein PHH49_03140 [Candidatus Omnitrophica bacterium]|nr:hypothetical protein [Candidatus Omnitrophota bacterium]MDD5487946.1 hypothetical protein [Candidatus Omnitrophota bacterium]
MIKLDITTALVIYLFISTVLVLIIWSFYDFGVKLKTFSSDEKHLWHCSICALAYIDSLNEEISKCPRCGSFNQKGRYGLARKNKRSGMA